jgi:hypothetical protein
MINFLDETASKVFVSIYNQLNDDGCLELNKTNGTYEPLFVKKLDVISLHSEELERISFGHYYDQEGRKMADPEMIFLYNPKHPDRIAPCYFKMDGLGKEEYSISFSNDGVAVELRRKMQKGHTVFADVWMSTIMNQQLIII